ncbi:hypothetical protein LJR234_000339 [Mesorhizobium amorphae]|uniref:hypothetical protein n=1 Tax=Mesorhizobium amorphae TaxID=71433 RepID=UPI003ED02574
MAIVQKSRRFSKGLVIVNCALAWTAVFVSIVYAQAAAVAATAIGLILAVSGTYMGVGHLDMRQMVQAMLAAPPMPSIPITDGGEPEEPANSSVGQ